MRRTLAVTCAVLLFTTLAFAASVHFKPNSVELTDQGAILLAEGSLAGLSNADVTILVTATSTPTVLCTNKGGNKAPGVNPSEATVSGDQTILASEVDNGQAFFSVTTDPLKLTSAQGGCPNDQWTATVQDLEFHEVTISVFQLGVLVLQETFMM